jgi:hypothetical protein
MRALAEKADQLMALHQPQSHDAVALYRQRSHMES